MSKIDRTHTREKAEQVLEALVSVLSSPTHLTRFSAAIPLTRVLVLLLGERPSAFVAVQILKLVGLAIKASASFLRKFELVSGWTALKHAVPQAWSNEVQRASFDVLFGVVDDRIVVDRNMTVVCPHILPTILIALDHILNEDANGFSESKDKHRFIRAISDNCLN
jgi:hypothetical protein